MPKFSALIAAAGLSSRMGFPKALMNIGGKTAALRLVHTFLAASVEEITIALPDWFLEGEELKEELLSLDVILIKNRFAHFGYAGSIMSGISQISIKSLGVFISPIDVLVKVTLIRAMRQIAQSYAQKPVILVPYCPFKPGHPVYLSRHFFSALNCCSDGLHCLIERHQDAVVKVASFDKNALLNINSKNDLSSIFGA